MVGVGRQECAPLQGQGRPLPSVLALQDVIQGVHGLTCLLQWIIEDPLLIATGEAIPLRGLEGVPGLPGVQ